MSIRLLKKDEIAKAKNADRALEIAEGVKLSRRVDSLRELQAKEEKSLEDFRKQSIETINAGIKELSLKKESILSEIKNLEEYRDDIKPSLEKKEAYLNDFEEKLIQKKDELNEKSILLDAREIKTKENLKKSEDYLSQAESRKEISEELHRNADTDRKEAQQTLSHARQIQQNTIVSAQDIEKKLIQRESDVSNRENICVAREKNIEKEEKFINEEKIRIADQQETIKRTLWRMHQKTKTQ